MKKTIVAALAAALMSSGAYAADAFDKGSTKDAGIFSAPTRMNWTGVFIGGSLGYGHANHELSLHDYYKDFCSGATQDQVDALEFDYVYGSGASAYTLNNINKPVKILEDCGTAVGGQPVPLNTIKGDSIERARIDGVDSSGLVGDGRIGFDVQRGRFVGGIFATYGFNDMSTDVSFGGTTVTAIEKGDEWSVGARAGILVNDRTLAYILAAYTESEFSFAGIGANGGNKEVNFSGLTVGGGIEFALTQNVFLGVEGTHTFYGEETIADFYNAGANMGTRLSDEIGETKVLGTLKLKLNTGLGGVID